ncbi:hypothetical protein OIU77_028651 [Salix suchowensis]|uniref:Oligopeptide transporter n=1 Tax=Salix suchowensis TaxID=1278906 RepID=A0ABQ9BKE1_9ROSI|nr:hypothetical protein OIU77_028651 [Salix suchowensis]
MGSLEIQAPYTSSKHTDLEKPIADAVVVDDDVSPVEEVRLTVANTDDPNLTSMDLPDVVPRPNFMQPSSFPQPVLCLQDRAAYHKPNNCPSSFTPNRPLHGCCATENQVQDSCGSAYAVGIVTIIKAFYGRSISFFAGWLLITTTQVLGYGWAGLLRKYVVEPAHMWWPGTLVQGKLLSNFDARHLTDM